jgi:hypothetical protein
LLWFFGFGFFDHHFENDCSEGIHFSGYRVSRVWLWLEPPPNLFSQASACGFFIGYSFWTAVLGFAKWRDFSVLNFIR